MRNRLLGTSACCIVLGLSVSACGGGGGTQPQPIAPAPPGTAPPPTPPPPPPPTPPPAPIPGVNYDTAEYQASTYAVAANALAAYNAGASGAGVKIGIVDSGINPTLKAFAGRIDPASGDVYGTRGVSDEGGHGTAVSAVAAAARDSSGTMGVAFAATIISERADNPGSCSNKAGCTFYDDGIAAGIDAAVAAGAKVINLSLGGSTPGATLLAAMQRAVNAGTVLVIAAGNDSTTSPDPFALTPAQKFPGMVIIAGSLGVDDGSGGVDTGTISTFSDRAGTGANYYLMALGFNDRAPDQAGTEYYWSGTSFSAPTISGAVALMAQAFPNLTGKQIVDILFTSADDLGAAGIDSIYGHGRMNIARAFQPIGATSLAGSQIPVTGSNGDLPPASGDAVTGQSMGAIILDGYDRAYVVNLAKTLRRADVDHPLARSLQNDVKVVGGTAGPISIAMTVRERHDLVGGFALERTAIGPQDLRKSQLIAGSAIAKVDRKTAIAFGFAEGAKAMERRLKGVNAGAFLIARDVTGDPGFNARRNGSMAVRHSFGGTAVTVSGETGSVWQEVPTSASGSPYRYASVAADRRFGSNWLSLGVSRLEEKQSLLGGRMSDVLGGGGANSLFLDAEARRDLGSGWSGTLTARRGWTSFAAGKFQTGAYAFDLAKTAILGDSDTFGLRLAQPLRVEHGGFAMWLPTSYDYATQTAVSGLSRMSLRPSGREIDGELSYGRLLLDGNAWMGGNLFYRRQPGHIADSKSDAGAAVRLTLDF
ncbi:MAG: S8 family peptidase [Pseudomonadota bacterium]